MRFASFASLTLLVKIIRKQKLAYFSWYMFLLGAAVIVWQMLTLNKG
jgi:undecaprenyl pyrophosphate phosphatase UppP